MKSTLRSMYFRNFAASLLLILLVYNVSGQTQKPRYNKAMTPNCGGYYECLPDDYNKDKDQTYPLLIFVHGIGEMGDGSPKMLPTVLANGTPKLINEGKFPASFTVNGQTFQFIVLSPQFGNWPTAEDIKGVIDYAISNYRVNTSRIYLTGLSMGGGAVWDYSGSSVANANRVAAIVPVCGASDPLAVRCNVLTNASLPIWATHNLLDPTVPSSNTIGYVDLVTSLTSVLNPLALLNPIVKKTIFPVEGHDAWTTTYNPTFKENGKNIYEWMLQFQRGGAAPAPPPAAPSPNQNPVSNAGSDVSITLPTNSVTLSGSGADGDGNITNYSWTKISGPSQFSINYGNIPYPTISNLVEGTYTLRLTVTDNSGGTAYDDINITVNAAPIVAPFAPSNVTANIPGKIEAENYSNMFGIINEKTSDDGGGLDVGWIEMGDWMEYNVNVATAGSYTVNFRVASPYAGLQLQLRNGSNAVLSTVGIPQTGAFQTWRTVSTTVNLNAGSQTLKIYSSQNGWWNINWAEFVLVPQAAPAAGTAAIPGRIESENYNSMFGVMAENTADNNGGLDVGWIEMGDWMDYNVRVATAGNYTVNFRVATPYANQQLQLKNADGSLITSVAIPQTGGFQIWRTVSATVNLKAGTQTLRVYSSQNGWWNINWMEFAGSASSDYNPIPGRVEAEAYSTSFGIITESTADDGGGLDVGWIELGDWLEYKVNVAAAGNYAVNFRVASPFSNQQFQVKSASGSVLATVNVPNTGAFQNWRTVSVPLYLFAGNQTIRLYSIQNGWWNINFMDFAAGSLNLGSSTDVQASTGALSGSITADNANLANRQLFSIYPNPVKSMFQLQVSNQYTGSMEVQIVNQAGSVVKQFKATKDAQLFQKNLPIAELPAGTYFLKVQIGKWTDSKKLLKL